MTSNLLFLRISDYKHTEEQETGWLLYTFTEHAQQLQVEAVS